MGSYLWLWQRAHSRVRPRNAVANVLVRSATYSIAELFLDASPLVGLAVVAVESRREDLRASGLRHEVAGQLPGDELVVGQVGIESLHDPVAPGPHGPIDIGLIAVCVGISGQVEPIDGHPLAEAGRIQQPVDHAVIGIGGRIGQKRVDLGDRRRQSRKVEAHASDQPFPAGLGRGRQSSSVQASLARIDRSHYATEPGR